MQVKSTARKLLLIPVINVIWNSAISKSTDRIVAGVAQTHLKNQQLQQQNPKTQGTPESAFSAFGCFVLFFFLLRTHLLAFSVSLVCTGTFQDGSAPQWKQAVQLSCVTLPNKYTLCVVMAATVNHSKATWQHLINVCSLVHPTPAL